MANIIIWMFGAGPKGWHYRDGKGFTAAWRTVLRRILSCVRTGVDASREVEAGPGVVEARSTRLGNEQGQ